MDIRLRVGANVKAAREAKGWSQEELAHQAEMHRTYISGIERGVRNPTITVLERVGKALGIRPGRLLDGS
jgi:transcriptional regulator with XRE-family HTH domain